MPENSVESSFAELVTGGGPGSVAHVMDSHAPEGFNFIATAADEMVASAKAQGATLLVPLEIPAKETFPNGEVVNYTREDGNIDFPTLKREYPLRPELINMAEKLEQAGAHVVLMDNGDRTDPKKESGSNSGRGYAEPNQVNPNNNSDFAYAVTKRMEDNIGMVGTVGNVVDEYTKKGEQVIVVPVLGSAHYTTETLPKLDENGNVLKDGNGKVIPVDVSDLTFERQFADRLPDIKTSAFVATLPEGKKLPIAPDVKSNPVSENITKIEIPQTPVYQVNIPPEYKTENLKEKEINDRVDKLLPDEKPGAPATPAAAPTTPVPEKTAAEAAPKQSTVPEQALAAARNVGAGLKVADDGQPDNSPVPAPNPTNLDVGRGGNALA